MSRKKNAPLSWGDPAKGFENGSSSGANKGKKGKPINSILEYIDFYSDFDTTTYYSSSGTEYLSALEQGRPGNPHPDKKHGWEYRIFLDVDKNNFTTGDSVLIQRQQYGLGPQNNKGWEDVTDEDLIDKINNMPETKELYKDWLTANANDSEEKKDALQRSGNIEYVDGNKSLEDLSFTSDPESISVTDDVSATQISPEDLTENYKNIFKSDRALKYPIDMFVGGGSDGEEKGSQDYIYFEQFTYSPPQAGGVIGKTGSPDEGNVTLDETDVDLSLRGGIGSKQRIKNAQGMCMLPIPNKLGISNGVSWGEARANAVEFTAFNAASGSVQNLAKNPFNIFNEIANLTKQGGKILDTTFKELKRGDSTTATAGSVVNAVVAKALLSRLNINVDVDQFITRQTGAAINPNLELLFSGPQLRTFSFSFEFAPNSQEEAKEVRMIQRWFREGMLPRKNTIGTNGATLFLGSPNVFRVCYKNDKRRIKGLNTFKICALTSCEIDFTPDGVYQSYSDKDGVSQPVRSTMALTFNELTPIFRNDYGGFGDGFNEDDPTLVDVKDNITGDNKFTEDDLGF